MLSSADLAAIFLTVKLAAVTTVLLLFIGTPIAWWLARSRSIFKNVVGAVVTLPLVLPPAVLGFYLLVMLGPQGPLGQPRPRRGRPTGRSHRGHGDRACRCDRATD
jgi:molybdate transport system permease protein